jgi:hypothetical protein
MLVGVATALVFLQGSLVRAVAETAHAVILVEPQKWSLVEAPQGVVQDVQVKLMLR